MMLETPMLGFMKVTYKCKKDAGSKSKLGPHFFIGRKYHSRGWVYALSLCLTERVHNLGLNI